MRKMILFSTFMLTLILLSLTAFTNTKVNILDTNQSAKNKPDNQSHEEYLAGGLLGGGGR
ncbi:hypothetical protein SAMN05444392_11046 [Seinonella peptonophila]|uniref:Uncharacterized protein n=1 Tax=Seinonella peptonophila TaxID=112248 RepID=A0A1M4ZQH7_9BACL|nr:hypothetical protein [Seinonella peptonophila]SHF20057.1 hypothetical protein SAMN05444392_11046 [Seinonella peptonophila]